MAWTRYTHASVSAQSPRALGACDRCGMVYQHSRLLWQYDWVGPRLQNMRILVCPTCMDTPQQNGQLVLIPPDPIPILNPRPDPHMFMEQSSSPDTTQAGAPTVMATEGSDPLVTESSQSITWEQQTTPTPTSSGYTVP